MGEILSQLKHLFIQSTPTVIFVLILMVVLDRLLFRPVAKVLKDREEATTGALARARERAEAAETKRAQYEAALNAARQESYRLREEIRRAVLAERESILKKGRAQAEIWLKEARQALARQNDAAKQELDGSCQKLAEEIAETILRGQSTLHTEGTGRT